MPTFNTEEELTNGLMITDYIFTHEHQLYDLNSHRLNGENIGINGKNLTISFLSMNRAALSIRLIDSLHKLVPDFSGEILIIDQSSDKNELDRVREACERLSCRWRIIEFAENYGVSGGRNRTMPYVETEWIMSLDNDMIFLENPLPYLQKDIALLGCHFINLPILNPDRKTLFARGGHLYTQCIDGNVFVGGGSAFRPTKTNGQHNLPFLSTFLFGGASVMRVDTFMRVGQYDENMFIGFEDIDFSIRLFKQGYKIGNTHFTALIHDHPKPDDNTSKDYEQQRYSKEILRKSALYLESKHTIKIWNEGVETWLSERREKTGLDKFNEEITDNMIVDDKSNEEASNVVIKPRRARIALVVDAPWWAFWNISQQIATAHSHRFDIDIFCTKDIDNIAQLFYGLSDFDVIHIFWREYLRILQSDHFYNYLQWSGVSYKKYMHDIIGGPVISTCIYDHLHLDKKSLADRSSIYKDLVDAYYVGSNRLHSIYEELPDYPKPLAILPDGVSHELFFPCNLDRFKQVTNRTIHLGWVGNSSWGDGNEDYKGVFTILKPAVYQLQLEGYPIELHLVDRAASQQIRHDQMVNFYASLDCYICTSSIEGTPNPILESMACGVPIITTDVGIVPDAFGPHQQQYILEARSVESLKSAIRQLIERPQNFDTLSAENLAQVSNWYWKERVKGFADYFEACLALRQLKCSD